MIYLVLSVCCNLAVAAIFKHNEMRRWNRVALLTANYLTAAVAAAVMVLGGPGHRSFGADVLQNNGLLVLAGITGALFISTYFILAWATKLAGMGLATGVLRVSVVVPVLAAWVIWKEVPSAFQIVGLLLAGTAFFFIAHRRDRGGSPSAARPGGTVGVFGVLLLLFASGGIVDTCLKLFDEEFALQSSDTMFLLLVYLVAWALGSGWLLVERFRTGQWPGQRVLLWGVLLGLCNYAATLFFLRAVGALEAPFVFPANSAAVVLGAALIGVYGWGEKLSGFNWVGLGLAAAALVLLRL